MSHARRNPAISEGLLKGVGANARAVRYTLGELKRIVTKGFKYMRGLIVDYVGVLDGTEEDNRRWKALLAAAKANGAATAILSNDPGGPGAEHIREWEYRGNVDAVVLSGEVGAEKPEVAAFQAAADALELPLNDCVMVDDSILNVRAAVESGMVGFLYTSFDRVSVEIQAVFDIEGEAKARVYIPATYAMLAELEETGSLSARSGWGFMVTPALQEFYTEGDEEEVAYSAFLEASMASMRLLAIGDEEKFPHRRVVISVDLDDSVLTPRPDMGEPVVELKPAQFSTDDLAAIHVDIAESEETTAKAIEAIDTADLGDEDAELAVGDALDKFMAFYHPTELPFLVELL